MKTVAVIGGGFAGLSAGVALAGRGLRVALLEGRPRLGGRAYSFTDEATGETVDNGQHAMMGCYRHTLAFLDDIGAGDKLMRQPRLHVDMVDTAVGPGAIACSGLPSPLHMLSGILGYRLLTPRERWLALLGGARLMGLRRRGDPRLREWTVEQILVHLGQSENARRRFWYPVAVATLNELPARAAAAPFAEVLAQAFFASRRASQFVLPRVGLSDLYTGDARRCIESRGGEVLTRAAVAAVAVNGGAPLHVHLRDGRHIEADAVISAVPPRALGALLPLPLRDHPLLRSAAEITSSPIVSVHSWYDRPLFPGDFVGLVGTTAQWVFNRTRLTAGGAGIATAATGNAFCVSAVISAGYDVVDRDPRELAALVAGDLRKAFPASAAAQPLRSVVVKEKHATMSPTPANERRRPAAETPLDRFFLAGDWTHTGLPATIESAVLSGRRAATLAAARLGA